MNSKWRENQTVMLKLFQHLKYRLRNEFAMTRTKRSCWTRFSISSVLDSEMNSEWQEPQTVMLNLFQHLFHIRFRNKFGMTRNPMVMLNSFQHLFCIRFRNPLELLFHTTQSLILFALQILFAMLRATSSFGLRPHSTQNSQIRNDEKIIIIKRLSKKPTVVLNLFQYLL